MEDTKDIPLFPNAGNRKIEKFSLNTFLQNLGIEKNPVEYIKQLDEHLNLREITIQIKEDITEAEYLAIAKGEKKVTALDFGFKAEWTIFINEVGLEIIAFYKYLLTEFIDANTSNYYNKLDELNTTIDQLSAIRNNVFLRNRFSFAGNTSFRIRAKNMINKPAQYYMIDFPKDLYEDLKDMFQIRFEVFDELLMQTKLTKSLLESRRYQYSKFKLDQRKGKFLIMELVLGLTGHGSHLDITRQEREQLIRELFDFFGVAHEKIKIHELESDVYDKEGIGKHLEFLKEIIIKNAPVRKRNSIKRKKI